MTSAGGLAQVRTPLKSCNIRWQRLAIEECLCRNERHSHCSLHLRAECRSHVSGAVAMAATEVRDTYGLGRRKLCKFHPYQDIRVLGILRSTLPRSSQPRHTETRSTPGPTLNPHQMVSNPVLERSKVHKMYLCFHHLPEWALAITLRLRDVCARARRDKCRLPDCARVTAIHHEIFWPKISR